MKIAVLSDIHGVAGAYSAALSSARQEGFDALLILGDLLTYGLDPEEILDLTEGAVSCNQAILILGNHDQLYLDLSRGTGTYRASLPDWIRESVDWTCARLGKGERLSGLPWQQEWSCASLLAAHANPFPYGDWRYLSDTEQMVVASAALDARGFALGLFGHTHRFRQYSGGQACVTTVGSVGQPRDGTTGWAHWAMLEHSSAGSNVMPRRTAYDWSTHVAAIRSTTMSEATQHRLCNFYQ